MGAQFFQIARRSFADVLLFGATLAELVLLAWMTPRFTPVDFVYVLQHLLVLIIALMRRAPAARDSSLATLIAIGVCYAYPYAQVIVLRSVPGEELWFEGGLALVVASAGLSLVSLLTLGRHFGLRPALRGLTTRGPYALVRHPMYLSYVVSDVGYNLQEWSAGTIALTLIGWASLIYRIQAEERVLAQDAGWQAYAGAVRYRMIPGVW